MQKLSIYISILFISISSFSQVLEFADFETLEKEAREQGNVDETFGFSDKLPSSFSLEKYTVVSNQGPSASCVGFAVARGAMSIIYNMINNLSSDEKLVHTFDPFYIYGTIRDSREKQCGKNGCLCPSRIHTALMLVKDFGCKKSFVGPYLSCSSQLYKSDLRTFNHKTSPYEIDDFFNLVDYYKTRTGEEVVDVDIKKIKQAIAKRNPVIVGMDITDDFQNVNRTNQPYKSNGSIVGGHAVTVIGYDDYKYGGSFRILNSYGINWGDSGCFWITYKEFKKITQVAYVLFNEDWGGWQDKNLISGSKYYRGKNTNGTLFWEGEVDSNRKFHGAGILVGSNFCAAGIYKNGVADGWWLHYTNRRIKKDGFRGRILYKNGEIIDSESFGFSESNESWEQRKKDLHLETFDLNLSDDPGEEDDLFLKDLLDIKNGY